MKIIHYCATKASDKEKEKNHRFWQLFANHVHNNELYIIILGTNNKIKIAKFQVFPFSE